MAVKTYINDGLNRNDGLGNAPTTITPAVGDGWYIDFEKDTSMREEIRRSKTAGVQIKNASDQPIRVKIEGSELAELVVAKKAGETVIVEHPAGILIQNAGTGDISGNTIIVTVTTGANVVSGATGLGDIYVTQDFTGTFYTAQYTAADDNAHAFTETSTKLADVIIRCSGNAALIGNLTNQYWQMAVGDEIGLTKIDLSTLYIKNAQAGSNTVITVIGVTI
jgi:hypothetical protein